MKRQPSNYTTSLHKRRTTGPQHTRDRLCNVRSAVDEVNNDEERENEVRLRSLIDKHQHTNKVQPT